MEMTMKKTHFSFLLSRCRVWLALCFSGFFLIGVVHAQEDAGESETDAAVDERDEASAQTAALGNTAEEEESTENLDFMKGLPMVGRPQKWPMGPAGIIGVKNCGNKGNQVRVLEVLAGSPAVGKIFPGDVILGVGGKKFTLGGDIDWLAGNAIIEAESDAGKGLLKLDIWRDRNWAKRAAPADLATKTMDELIADTERSQNDLYAWQSEKGKANAVKHIGLDKFPVDAFFTNVVLQLEVLGTYSDDSPWNCPVAAKIREKAWRFCAAGLEAQMKEKSSAYNNTGGGQWPNALALVASGKPEYLELVKKWVHSRPKLEQDINKKISPINFSPSKTWNFGFDPLEMAIYYDATGDKFILPSVRLAAIRAAMCQSAGGAWGHGGTGGDAEGRLHWSLGGYGAVNNAGSRCFMLLAMAKKAGIEDPEINAAIARSSRYWRTFVDKGSMPYGYHGPVLKFDDECGRNYGVTYAYYALGQKYEAKYYAMNSANAAFEGRGRGHGSRTLWYYTPWSANVCGPEVIKAYMRNMRYYYTLARLPDGNFLFWHKTGLGDCGMRNPAATFALYYSYPLKQTIITGKDADPECWMTDKEFKEVLVSTRPNLKDPVLLERGGTPWQERSTDELIDMLDHFFPRMRLDVAKEVARRYAAGEKAVVDKLVRQFADKSARMRTGACDALSLCGKDAVVANMPKVVALFKDDAEIVRMAAIKTIGVATQPGDKMRELEVLKSLTDAFAGLTADNGNLHTAAKEVLLAAGKKGQASLLASQPFKAGYDENLVRGALEKIVLMNPAGTVPNAWDKETLIKLAGPIVFSAEDPLVNEKMWGSARQNQAKALLKKYGYKEAYDAQVKPLRNWAERERTLRQKPELGKKGRPIISPKIWVGSITNEASFFRPYLNEFCLCLREQPTISVQAEEGQIPLAEFIKLMEKDASAKPLPSIAEEVTKMFGEELARAGGVAEQIKLCRSKLADVNRKNYFEKMSAMSYLVKTLGVKAVDDIVPFFGHEQWRLNEHVHTLVVDLAKQGGGDRLVEICNAFLSKKNGADARKKEAVISLTDAGLTTASTIENKAATFLLTALADAGFTPALTTAKEALKHDDAGVRRAAVQAVFKIGGNPELKTVLAFLRTMAKEGKDFDGVERALLSRKDDPAHVQQVSGAAITLLPVSEPAVQRSLAWVLGQFGGSRNLAAIASAIKANKDENDLKELMRALALSPDRGATKVMTGLLTENKLIRNSVAQMAVYRMVDPLGKGGVTNEERLFLAREVLTVKYDEQMITYLGQMCSLPALELLYEVMTKASGDPNEWAAIAILNAAEKMEKQSPSNNKRIADMLVTLVEYIDISHLRGGVEAHWKGKFSGTIYKQWEERQVQAGKVVLKFANPEADATKNIDDTRLDI
jgi:DNA-binding phage protein